MIDFRFVVPEGTSTPRPIPRLQYRFKEPFINLLNPHMVTFADWTSWRDVPVVVLPATARADEDAGAANK